MRKTIFVFTTATLLAFSQSIFPAGQYDSSDSEWTYQNESPADRSISDRIRRVILKDDRFSNNARNTQIVTKNGVVRLTGTAVSESEKNRLAQIAKQIEGVSSVDDQVVVKTPGSIVKAPGSNWQ